jgi:membrane-bound lytic murein transglycosylase B
VSAVVGKSSGTLAIGASMAAALLVIVMAVVAILAALLGQSTRAEADAVPSTEAEGGIPASYLTLYRHAGRQHGVPWQVLAGIGSIETDHGRSRAPGVHSGVNSYGCCAGPMQFNLRDGPPSTLGRYGVDGNHDGTKDV